MSVEITPLLEVPLAAGGTTFVRTDTARPSAEISVNCDGPRCGGRHAKIKWCQHEVADQPDALPDAAFRILKLELFDNTTRVFLGADCLRDYLDDFTPLMSPKEKAR